MIVSSLFDNEQKLTPAVSLWVKMISGSFFTLGVKLQDLGTD